MDYDDYNEYSSIKDWAKITKTNQPIHASVATKKDGPFYCADTYEELIVRKCVDKRDHFAYKGRLSPVYSSNESKLHFECKHEICNALKEKYPQGKWDVERTIVGNKDRKLGKLVPDISGRINDKPIAIEIQVSSMTLPKIIKRVEGYYARGVSILWVVPLKEDLGNENFRPRQYERFLHSLYYGKIFYWQKGDGLNLTPVHFDSADRYIEEAHWFDEDGSERTEGGYYKTYQTIFKPNYAENVDLSKFISHEREEFVPDNENKTIPKCLIFKDKIEVWWKDKNNDTLTKA